MAVFAATAAALALVCWSGAVVSDGLEAAPAPGFLATKMALADGLDLLDFAIGMEAPVV
jgi:hypothetical protein